MPLKNILRSVIPSAVRRHYKGRHFKNRTAQEVFTYIYENRFWNKQGNSVSGAGSELTQTRIVSAELPRIFQKYNVHSFLDIPCGDFNWMRLVMEEQSQIQYVGADIVEELVEVNQKNFGGENISFVPLNLIEDELPQVDLILCRDCFVHLSFDDVRRSLQNIVASGSRYLLANTFVDRKRNEDIFTGNHRHLNLQIAPFQLPPPLELIREKEPGYTGRDSDKSLGLWEIASLPR